MTRDRFEFRFKLSEDQFKKAHRAYLRRSLLSVKNIFMLTIALLIGVVQSQLFGAANWVLWIFGGAWLAVVGLCIFVYIWMPGRIFRARPSLSETQIVRVDEEGIEWKAGDRHRQIAWSEIKRVSHIHRDFIYFHPHHGLPEILPKSVFKSEEELGNFNEFVQKCIHSST